MRRRDFEPAHAWISHESLRRRTKQGLALRELAGNGFEETAHCSEAIASGETGTVYLYHPFLVHAAHVHRGTQPRFMAQPPLLSSQPLRLDRADEEEGSPVAQAIRLALVNDQVPRRH
jgi:hypothetical protein